MEQLAEAVKRTIHDPEFLFWAVKKNWSFRIVLYPNKDYMNEPVENLDLSTRAYNSLRRAGFITIGDVVTAIDRKEDLFRIRNLGAKSADEIMLKLFLFQYSRLTDAKKRRYLARIREINH